MSFFNASQILWLLISLNLKFFGLSWKICWRHGVVSLVYLPGSHASAWEPTWYTFFGDLLKDAQNSFKKTVNREPLPLKGYY